MRRFRVSIASLMGLVAISAVGLVSLREGTLFWSGLTYLAMCLAIAGSALNAAILPRKRRAAWAGFALFAWVYYSTQFNCDLLATIPPKPGEILGDWLLAKLHSDEDGLKTFLRSQLRDQSQTAGWKGNTDCFKQTVHSLLAVVCGLIGATAGRWLMARSMRRPRVSKPSASVVTPQPVEVTAPSRLAPSHPGDRMPS